MRFQLDKWWAYEVNAQTASGYLPSCTPNPSRMALTDQLLLRVSQAILPWIASRTAQ
jgi:hypothetical protein